MSNTVVIALKEHTQRWIDDARGITTSLDRFRRQLHEGTCPHPTEFDTLCAALTMAHHKREHLYGELDYHLTHTRTLGEVDREQLYQFKFMLLNTEVVPPPPKSPPH